MYTCNLDENGYTRTDQNSPNWNQHRCLKKWNTFYILLTMAFHAAIKMNVIDIWHDNTDKSYSQNMSIFLTFLHIHLDLNPPYSSCSWCLLLLSSDSSHFLCLFSFLTSDFPLIFFSHLGFCVYDRLYEHLE